MTLKEAIEKLTQATEKVGGDAEFVVMSTWGENDYIKPDYMVACDLEDQDGNSYKCALIGESGGEELTKVGIPHFDWDPEQDKI